MGAYDPGLLLTGYVYILRRKMVKLFRTLGILAVLALVLFAPMSAFAASSTAGDVAQSYSADSAVRQGMIVALNQQDPSKVDPLSSSNISDMFGVVISASAAPLTLSGTTTNQVYVATDGQYPVLVSNQNGPIRVGDYISISGLDGIGMKAQGTESTVLGKALSSFNGTSNATSTATISHGGSTTTVGIGIINVTIAVANNPNQSHSSGGVPGFLSTASTSIANKPVSTPRIYLSVGVLVITAFIAGSLLYSGVKNGLVSIGRNPLAKRYIFRSLLQVVLVSIIVFILGLFAVYLLLRL